MSIVQFWMILVSNDSPGFPAGGGGWGGGTSDIPSLPSRCIGRICSCDSHKSGPQAKMQVCPKAQKMCKYFHLQASHGGFINIYATEAPFCFKLGFFRARLLVCSLPLKKSVTRTLICLCESLAPPPFSHGSSALIESKNKSRPP